MKSCSKFIGCDPSFTGLGLSFINTEKRLVGFTELSVELGEGSFAEITKAAVEMCNELIKINFENTIIGMEIPPVSGFYTVKLWALDSRIYELMSAEANKVWLFNVPYLKFINGKDNTKKDTMKMIADIVDVFKFNGFEIIQNLKDKRGKDRKLTSNECDSFLYCIRVFVRHSLETGQNAEIIQDILNINERFMMEKETETGKSKKK